MLIAILSVVVYGGSASADDGDWVHSVEPYNYINGFFDDKDLINSTNISKQKIDNDLKTGKIVNKNVEYVDFKHPVNVKGIYMRVVNPQNIRLIFSFINGDKFDVNINKTGYVNLDFRNVKRIEFSTGMTGGFTLNELDFFGSYDKNVKIEKPEIKVEEIVNLKAEAKYNRVDLSWQNPKGDNFNHVNIFRDMINKSVEKSEIVSVVSTKIFETNGTYFNDLTVAAGNKYQYMLTTTYTDGLESAGVKKVVTVPKKPLPEMGGQETEVDADGNYIFKWTSPAVGQVKVIIGGKLYKTVNAADLQVKIPAADMKFTIFGSPDVKLIPVDTEGNEGLPVSPPSTGGGGGIGNIELPFGISDLVITVFSLIGLLSSFILLVLVLIFTPKFINMIKASAAQKAQKRGRL